MKSSCYNFEDSLICLAHSANELKVPMHIFVSGLAIHNKSALYRSMQRFKMQFEENEKFFF